MGNLRSVGGWGEVDLDQRAITTEDDIVDLSELDRSDDQPNQPAPARQNGAAEHDEPGEPQPPAAASQALRTPAETRPPRDAPGRESDEDFDRWVAHRAPGLGSALAASKPSTPPLAGDARRPAPRDAATAASGTAGVPCDDPTVPPVASSRSRLRCSGPLSRPLGRLARPAAAIGVLTLAAGGTAIAINEVTTSTPHARPPVASSNAAALIAGPSSRAGGTLSATFAAVTSELGVLARAVPRAPRTSHLLHKPRRHGSSHRAGISNHRHPAAGEQNATSAQTSPTPRTYSYTRATVRSGSASVTPSSTSQTTAGSQTQATSRSQPAFGQNGSLGPGTGAPGTQ